MSPLRRDAGLFTSSVVRVMVLVVVCGAAIAADKPVQDPSVGPAAPSIYPQVHLQQPSRGYRTAPLAVSAAEARAREMIDAALQKGCEDGLEFSDMPLRDVVSSLGERWNVPIRIDRKSLDEAGIDPETSITNVAVKGETLRGVLQTVLDDIDLAWVVRGERLVITTKEAASGALITRLYPLPFGTAKQPVDFQPVIDAIVNTIGSPAAWADQGGDGQIRPADGGEPMLVVSQAEELHAEVEALLRGMHDRALAEFLDDAGQPRRTPVVRIHRCADKKTRDELVASLAGLCNAALAADGDPAAKVTALGQHIVVQSSKADFQALAGQVVAATVGVRPLPSSGLGEAGYSGQGNAGFGMGNVAVPQPPPQPGNANEAGQGAGAGPAAAGAGQAQARAPAPAAAAPAPAPPIYPQVHLQHPSRGYRVALLARSEAEARARKAIDAALRKGLDDVPEFNDKPLRDVVRTLENLWGLPIRIDHKSLDEAGIDSETPITTVGAKGETLRSVLQAVLDGIDLTWVVRGERLVITTKEKAEESLTTRLYPLPLGAATQPVDFQSLIDTIVNTFCLPAWAVVGGNGQISPLEGGEPLLVVMQTEEVHEAIEALLRGMHERALAEFLDDAGQPRRTPVVRVYRCADTETRDALVASLAAICNAALGDDDPAAKVTPLADNLVVQSVKPDFHALAGQVVAATVGVRRAERADHATGTMRTGGGMGGGME